MKSVYIVTYTCLNFNVWEGTTRYRSKERAIASARKWCTFEKDATVIGWHRSSPDDLETKVEWLSGVDNA